MYEISLGPIKQNGMAGRKIMVRKVRAKTRSMNLSQIHSYKYITIYFIISLS